MSLDVTLSEMEPIEVYSANITHNLGAMAAAAGIYQALWRPDEIGIIKARDLIAPLALGLAKMRKDPDKFKTLDSPNGWGTYDDFLPWVEKYYNACLDNPDAIVSVSR